MLAPLLALALFASPPDVDGAGRGERIRVTTKLVVVDGALTSVDEEGVRLKAGADDVLIPASDIVSVRVMRAAVSSPLPTPAPPLLALAAPPPPPVIHFRSPRTFTPASFGLGVGFAGFGAFRARGFDRAYFSSPTASKQTVPIAGEFGSGGALRIGYGRIPGRSDAGANGWLLAGGLGEGYSNFRYSSEPGQQGVFLFDLNARAGWFVSATPYAWKVRLEPYAALEGRALAPLFGSKKRADGTPLPKLSDAVVEQGMARAGFFVNEFVDVAAVFPLAAHDPFAAALEWKQGTSVEIGFSSSFGAKR